MPKKRKTVSSPRGYTIHLKLEQHQAHALGACASKAMTSRRRASSRRQPPIELDPCAAEVAPLGATKLVRASLDDSEVTEAPRRVARLHGDGPRGGRHRDLANRVVVQ